MMLTCPSCGARFRVKPEMFAAGPRPVRCARCRHEWRGQPDPEDRAGSVAAAPPPETAFEPPETDTMAESPPPEAEADAPEEIFEDDADRDRAENELEDDEAEGAPEAGRREPVFDTIPGAARPAADDFRPASRPSPRRTPAWVWGGWALIAAILVFTVLALAFLRDPIVRVWPPAARLFDQIEQAGGAAAVQPVSLTIETSRLTGAGEDAQMELGIRLTNESAEPQPLPIAVIHLLNASGELVKTERIRLNDDPLAPKESRSMRLLLEDIPDGLQKVRADTEPAE